MLCSSKSCRIYICEPRRRWCVLPHPSFQNINEHQYLGSIYFLLFIAAGKQRVAFMDMAVSTIAEICRVIRAPRAGK